MVLRTLTTYRASKKLGLEQAVLGTRNFNEVDLEESEARKVPLLCVTVFRRTTQCIVFLCYSKVVVSCCDVVHPLMSNCTISTQLLNFLSSLSDNFELRAASYHCRRLCAGSREVNPICVTNGLFACVLLLSPRRARRWTRRRWNSC
jgi:hypothetical protein